MTIDHAIELGRSANFANIMGYFTYTFVMTTITQGVTKSIGDYYDYVKNRSLVELRRALAHGTLNGAIRMAQGGKFEHGFLSGFVFSLGGSYLNSNGGNMSSVEKIAISAVIGGTAEALGGGKFANGAVTGAYVMALNHMLHGVSESKPIPDGRSAIQVYSIQELVSDIDRYSTATGVEVGGVMLSMLDGTTQYWILPWDKNDATTCIFDPERIPNIMKAVVGENYKFHSHLSENGPSFPDFFENSSNAHWTPNMYKRDFMVGKSAIFEINQFNGVMAPRG